MPATTVTAPLPCSARQVGRAAELAYLALDPFGMVHHVRRGPVGVQLLRARQHRGKQRRFACAERCRVLVEELLRRGLRAVDTIAELGDVEVDLEDAPLRPGQLEQYGEVR